ncbi:Transposase, partial [Dysosmobacter welbionis]
HISLEPMAPDGGRAGGPDVGDTAELLPAVRVGDVDLHRGDPHRLHGIQQGHTGVGV